MDYLVMEWLTPETLLQQQRLTPNEVATIIEQILYATAHVHDQGIVHWNIKPSNILIVSRKPIVCKLGGFATIGRSRYRAPEVIARKLARNDDYPCDIWSLGLTILDFCLFDIWRLRLSDWPTVIGQVPRPGPAWKALTDFATSMLNPDPRSRLTVAVTEVMLT